MESITKPETELERLIIKARELSDHTKSEATKRAYAADLRKFSRWCASVELQSLPADSETIALYLVHLDQIGRKPSTIGRALTALSQAHVLAGHPTPIDGRVRELKKGMHRLRGTTRNKKKPLTIDRLRRCIEHTPNDFPGVRDRAILLVGWTGALRRSEICNIDFEDIEELPEGFALTLGKTKTDQEGAGRKIGFPFVDHEHQLCSVRALTKWVKLASINSGAVFRQIGKGGRGKFFDRTRNRLSDKSISVIIKDAAERAGYERSRFSGHSLRSGLATTLAWVGIEERKIANITGHRSLKVLREYIHEGGLFRDHPISQLFSFLSTSETSDPEPQD